MVNEKNQKINLSPFPPFSLILILLSACATVNEYAPPSQEMRDQFGTIHLTTGTIYPDIDEPAGMTKMEAFSEGARKGGLGSLRIGAAFCEGGSGEVCVVSILAGVVIAPVAALVGGVAGATMSHSEEEVTRAVAAINTASDQFHYAELLNQEFIRSANHDASHVEIMLTEQVESDVHADTELELIYTEFGWYKTGIYDPDLYLIASIKAELTDNKFQDEIYTREWTYKGPGIDFFDLAADNALQLTNQMEEAVKALSHKMVQDLFVNKEVEREKNKPKVGQVITIFATPLPDIDSKK